MDLRGSPANPSVEELIRKLTVPGEQEGPFPDPGTSVLCYPSKGSKTTFINAPPSLLNLPTRLLRNIGNLLDVRSLMQLAGTNRLFYSFFHQPSTETGISIPLTIERFSVDMRQKSYDITFDVSSTKTKVKKEEARGFVERLKRWPFGIHIEEFIISWWTNATEAITLVHNLDPKSIGAFYTEQHLDFDVLYDIIEKCDLQELVLNSGNSTYTDKEVEYFLRKPFYELYLGFDLDPIEFIQSSKIPILGARAIYPEMLPDLVDKFLETNTLVKWVLDHNVTIFKQDVMEALNDFSHVNYSFGGPLPEKRPLVFIPDNYDDEEEPHGGFYILRDDGKLVYITDSDDCDCFVIEFVCVHIGPPVLAQ